MFADTGAQKPRRARKWEVFILRLGRSIVEGLTEAAWRGLPVAWLHEDPARALLETGVERDERRLAKEIIRRTLALVKNGGTRSFRTRLPRHGILNDSTALTKHLALGIREPMSGSDGQLIGDPTCGDHVAPALCGRVPVEARAVPEQRRS